MVYFPPLIVLIFLLHKTVIMSSVFKSGLMASIPNKLESKLGFLSSYKIRKILGFEHLLGMLKFWLNNAGAPFPFLRILSGNILRILDSGI